MKKKFKLMMLNIADELDENDADKEFHVNVIDIVNIEDESNMDEEENYKFINQNIPDKE